MSSSPEFETDRAALWEETAGRHVCRAPLWAAAGAPRHVFAGRPSSISPSSGARRGPEDTGELARRLLGVHDGVATLRQEHGITVCRVRRGDVPCERAGDGLSTDDPGLVLGVQSADCVPILIADRRRGAVAALHAGWRGTAAGMVPRALEHLAAHYGSQPQDLEAVMGPAIGGCCYVVGEEVRAAVAAGPLGGLALFSPAAGGRWRIDLARLNAAALERAGLPSGRIQALSACTRCASDRLHSYRAEGAGTGRNWSFVAAADAL